MLFDAWSGYPDSKRRKSDERTSHRKQFDLRELITYAFHAKQRHSANTHTHKKKNQNQPAPALASQAGEQNLTAWLLDTTALNKPREPTINPQNRIGSHNGCWIALYR